MAVGIPTLILLLWGFLFVPGLANGIGFVIASILAVFVAVVAERYFFRRPERTPGLGRLARASLAAAASFLLIALLAAAAGGGNVLGVLVIGLVLGAGVGLGTYTLTRGPR